MRRTAKIKHRRCLVGAANDEGFSRLVGYDEMRGCIVELLETARRAAARSINALMSAAYWEVGRQIVEHEQGGNDRAVYGDVLIERLAEDLTTRFGRGFSRQNLWQMRAFYITWSSKGTAKSEAGRTRSPRFLQTLSGESHLGALAGQFPLPWSAYVRLLSVKSAAARAFYETEALRCGWSDRVPHRSAG